MIARPASSSRFGERSRALDAADVRRHDDDVLVFLLPRIAEQHRGGVDVVDGNVEKARDLVGVHVDEQHAVDAGRRDQVGDELGRDRHARGAPAPVLAAVAEIGDDGSDPRGRRPLAGVRHDQELHQVLVHGRAGRLHDEDVAAAHVLHDLDADLAVAEAADGDAAERQAQVKRDVACERGMSFAGENSRRDRVQRRGSLSSSSVIVSIGWGGRDRTYV